MLQRYIIHNIPKLATSQMFFKRYFIFESFLVVFSAECLMKEKLNMKNEVFFLKFRKIITLFARGQRSRNRYFASQH